MDILNSQWAQGGALLILIGGLVWYARIQILAATQERQDAAAAAAKDREYLMGEWTEKQNRIYVDMQDRFDDVEDHSITTQFILTGMQEQLTDVIGRSYRVYTRGEDWPDAPKEWQEASIQMKRHTRATDRVIEHLDKLSSKLEQRRENRLNNR